MSYSPVKILLNTFICKGYYDSCLAEYIFQIGIYVLPQLSDFFFFFTCCIYNMNFYKIWNVIHYLIYQDHSVQSLQLTSSSVGYVHIHMVCTCTYT